MPRFNISLSDSLITQLDKERGHAKRSTAIAAGMKYLLANPGVLRQLTGEPDETVQTQAQ